jgi:competence protein ComEC
VRDPLVAPLAAIAAGILLERWVRFEPRELLAGIAAFFLLSLLAWRSVRSAARLIRYARACCLAALALAGVALAQARRPATRPVLDAHPRQAVLLEGCVAVPSTLAEGREQFVVELEPGARARVSVYLREGETAPALRYGERVEVEARVREPRNFGNPGAFDYASYLRRREIFWLASASGASAIRRLPGSCGEWWRAAVFRLREHALQRADRLWPSGGYVRGLMKATLLGDDSQLERVWVDEFRRTGTYHAIVISGAHVGALSAALFLLLCWTPRAGRGWAVVATVWLYALVTGGAPPVVRSALGLTLFLLCRAVYREPRWLNLLALAALCFLIPDPEVLFDASFQLTFLAVLLLTLLAGPLVEQWAGWRSRALRGLGETRWDPRQEPRAGQFRVEARLLGETLHHAARLPLGWSLPLVEYAARGLLWLGGGVAASAVMQIGFALPMAIFFHRVSFTGLAANLAVLLPMGGVVPLGLAALVTGSSAAAAGAAWLLTLSRNLVAFLDRWEPRLRIPDPPWWLAVLCVLLLVALAAAKAWPWPRRILSAGLLAALAVVVWHPFAPRQTAGQLELTAIDVGHGDALLVALPRGGFVLVDTGGLPVFGGGRRPRLDIGEEVVSTYLWTRSIRRLDAIAVTHADDDHAGGLRALLDNFAVGELWTGVMPRQGEWAALEQAAAARGIPVRRPVQGDILERGGARFEVVWPPPGMPAPTERDFNNGSLTLRLTYGKRAFLLAGDLERRAEQELVASGLPVQADVLKVAHHGSRTSSTAALLDAVRPSLALISTGYRSVYGHPHPDVLARLRQRGMAVLRTDLHGLLTVRTDGQSLDIAAQAWRESPVLRSPGFAP